MKKDFIIISEDECDKMNWENGGIYYHLMSKIYYQKFDDDKFYPIRICKKCDKYFDFKKGKRLCDKCLN